MVYEEGDVDRRLCWEDKEMDGVFQARRQSGRLRHRAWPGALFSRREFRGTMRWGGLSF